MPGGRVAALVVKRTASSTATRSTTRPGRQVRAEPHPRGRRSNVSSPAATNGLERSGARWRIRTIQKYFRGAIRSRISSVHSTSLQGQRVSPRHRGARAPPPPPVCKRCVRVWALLLHWPTGENESKIDSLSSDESPHQKAKSKLGSFRCAQTDRQTDNLLYLRAWFLRSSGPPE